MSLTRGSPRCQEVSSGPGEDLRAAAERELAEETSIDGSAFHLEQLATYGAPDRDPRPGGERGPPGDRA